MVLAEKLWDPTRRGAMVQLRRYRAIRRTLQNERREVLRRPSVGCQKDVFERIRYNLRARIVPRHRIPKKL
uniref:Uncharacterized protein n=1 Tax=Trichuris muris TaxID=70415 RepID=A0A5S6QD94_TRIMR